jgi:hypothetical protein
MAWQRIVLIVVGAVSLASSFTTVAAAARIQGKQGQGWTGEDVLIAVTVLTPRLVFGTACVVVGIWDGTRDLLFVAGAVLVVGYLAQRLLARRIADDTDAVN